MGFSAFLQPLQDLTVEDRVSRTQYQYSLEDANTEELTMWTGRLVGKLKQIPILRTMWRAMSKRSGLEAQLVIDRDTASRLGITPQNIDDTLARTRLRSDRSSTIFTQHLRISITWCLEVAPKYQRASDPQFSRQHLCEELERDAGAAFDVYHTLSAKPTALADQSPGSVPCW